jgi:hypothetical protein
VKVGQSGRVACNGNTDLMLRFQLERGGDERRQRAHLNSIERKCDTTRWCDNVSRMRGSTEKKGGDDTSWADANLIEPKK